MTHVLCRNINFLKTTLKHWSLIGISIINQIFNTQTKIQSESSFKHPDLLQKPDDQEENVGVSSKLFEKKLRQKRPDTVFCGRDVVWGEFLNLFVVHFDRPKLWSLVGMSTTNTTFSVRISIFVQNISARSE